MGRNAEYWTKRFEELEKAQLLNETKYITELQEAYERTLSSVKKEINNWLVRFAVNNQISLKEAKKWLNIQELKELKWDINEYIKYGQENGIDLIWKKQLENASSKIHISRLEALELQIQQQVEKLYYDENNSTNDFILETYRDNYYKTAYELQKGSNVAFKFATLNLDIIQSIISKPWTTDEQTFSDRIWKNKKALIKTLQTDLTQSIILGNPPDKVIDKISKDFNVSKNKAGTLVMTESAFFSSASRQKCFNELGVQKYINIATLDSRTSDICREIDGTVYEMKDMKIGITAPPFHVRCRTTTAPYFEDEFEFGERAARNTDGKTYYVPRNITYKEWLEKYVYSDPATKKAFETDIKMNKNKSSDYEQYNRYKDILGDEMPKTFDKFQEMKYNNIDEWKNLKAQYSDALGITTEERAKKYIDNVNKTINQGKQDKHIIGSNNYIDGKSYLTISKEKAQELINQYAGKGQLEFSDSGKWNKKEIITVKETIGVVKNKNNEIKTNSFKIHYSKTGTHIVPYRKGGN
jgi:SPP1 gp7 family putative phage head morphogenesis protein|nr:MAG TPA: minor capsid protein [Caudoviricetes sp.]